MKQFYVPFVMKESSKIVKKSHLMWLVEEYGVDEYKKAIIKEVESYDRGVKIEDAHF